MGNCLNHTIEKIDLNYVGEMTAQKHFKGKISLQHRILQRLHIHSSRIFPLTLFFLKNLIFDPHSLNCS